MRRRGVIGLLVGLLAIGALGLTLADESAAPDGGASISVSVSDGGDTTIEVRHGELSIKAGGEVTRLSAGQGVHVERGKKPLKVSLLPAPGKLLPADGARVTAADLALSWAPVAGARKYHLVVAADAELKKVLQESTPLEGRAPIKLSPGVFYWQVQALDKDGLAGKLSPVVRLKVEAAPPKLKAGKPEWR